MYDHALTWSVEPASACSLLKERGCRSAQSIERSIETRAAVCVSPMRA